jgi:hypothetical protein
MVVKILALIAIAAGVSTAFLDNKLISLCIMLGALVLVYSITLDKVKK